MFTVMSLSVTVSIIGVQDNSSRTQYVLGEGQVCTLLVTRHDTDRPPE